MTNLTATTVSILVDSLTQAGILTCMWVHYNCLYFVMTSIKAMMFGYYLFIVLAKFEVIVYVMLCYSLLMGWIYPDKALWGWFASPEWIWRHIQSLSSISAYIFIRTHSSILLYVSTSSWRPFTWHNLQDSGLSLINSWRVEDKS